MNDRFRNLIKAHDHIVKGRSKEVRKVFIPHCGYVFVSSDALIKARIRRDVLKWTRAFNQWARSYYENTMQGVQI
jgi:hypothetical protein